MKKNTIISIFFIAVFSSVFSLSPIDKVAALLQQGQAHEIIKLASQNLELSILNDGSTVSKNEAEAQLNNFFATNKPIATKVIHRVDTNPNLLFAIILLKTNNGNFRVSFSIKSTNNNQELTELHIESEKTL